MKSQIKIIIIFVVVITGSFFIYQAFNKNTMTAKVTFQVKNSDGSSFDGSNYSVSIFDHDLISSDDFLGKGLIDDNGNGEIIIQNLTETGMLEKKPDLYIVLESESGQSSIKIESKKIFDDVDFANAENRTVDLGQITL